ncbi:hypothetical protein [Arenibaculum pallidiluteum]|uniref:hypothetical protein n=1 Tax=Arenibaculum pallidiluteum TaxID=2812559 RepID=UPI001A9773F0|nr:hypothetical protein [Arenibaculum pallidiluteum]
MSRTPENPGPTRADEDIPVATIRGQQHTWNHEERPQNEKEGNEAFGGTRKGAENVESGKVETGDAGKDG